MIQALIFDLGRVLVHVDFDRGYTAMARVAGLAPDEVARRLEATALLTPYEKGEVRSRDFARRVCAALGVELPYARFCEMWNALFERGALLPEPLIARLHERYRLVLLSNTNAIHFDFLMRTLPALRHFDAITVSHEAHAVKPEPAIYRDAIAKARCPAEECLYTDDIPAYVEGGRACGLNAIQFTGEEQWRAAARTAGLEL